MNSPEMHYQVLRLSKTKWKVVGVSNNPRAFPDRKNAVIVSSPRAIGANKAIELAQQHWQDTRNDTKDKTNG